MSDNDEPKFYTNIRPGGTKPRPKLHELRQRPDETPGEFIRRQQQFREERERKRKLEEERRRREEARIRDMKLQQQLGYTQPDDE